MVRHDAPHGENHAKLAEDKAAAVQIDVAAVA